MYILKFKVTISSCLFNCMRNLRTFYVFIYLIFLGHAHSMWNFVGLGLKQSCSSDNAYSLTTRPRGNSIKYILNSVTLLLIIIIHFFWYIIVSCG